MKEDHSNKQAGLSKRCNELYGIKDQQKSLRRREKELKATIMKDMNNTHVHEDAEGKIEKVCRKPKRLYDKDLLETELKKHGLAEMDIKAIIEASTRKIDVSEYLSVTPKYKMVCKKSTLKD